MTNIHLPYSLCLFLSLCVCFLCAKLHIEQPNLHRNQAAAGHLERAQKMSWWKSVIQQWALNATEETCNGCQYFEHGKTAGGWHCRLWPPPFYSDLCFYSWQKQDWDACQPIDSPGWSWQQDCQTDDTGACFSSRERWYCIGPPTFTLPPL